MPRVAKEKHVETPPPSASIMSGRAKRTPKPNPKYMDESIFVPTIPRSGTPEPATFLTKEDDEFVPASRISVKKRSTAETTLATPRDKTAVIRDAKLPKFQPHVRLVKTSMGKESPQKRPIMTTTTPKTTEKFSSKLAKLAKKTMITSTPIMKQPKPSALQQQKNSSLGEQQKVITKKQFPSCTINKDIKIVNIDQIMQKNVSDEPVSAKRKAKQTIDSPEQTPPSVKKIKPSEKNEEQNRTLQTLNKNGKFQENKSNVEPASTTLAIKKSSPVAKPTNTIAVIKPSPPVARVPASPKNQNILTEKQENAHLKSPDVERLKKMTCFEKWFVLSFPPLLPQASKCVMCLSLIKLGNNIKKISLPTSNWNYRITLQKQNKENQEKSEVYTGEVQDININEEDKKDFVPTTITFRRSNNKATSGTSSYDRIIVFQNKSFSISIDGKPCKLIGSPQYIYDLAEIQTLIEITNEVNLNHSYVENLSN